MKYLYSLIVAALFISPFCLGAQSYPYEIKSFNSDIDVTEEGIVEIQETLVVEFNEARRGIFRELPYRYQNNDGSIYTEVEIKSVLQDNQPAEFVVNRNNANLSIRIGDPEVYIQGQHVYVITYAVNGVLQNIGSEDELYWNVTGNGWDTTIETAEATIELPPAVNILSLACYQGAFGSQENCQADLRENSAIFRATNLAPYEGMTIASSWSAGQIPINAPGDPRDIWQIIIIVVPLLILITSSVYFYRRWERLGKDPEIPDSIVTQFDPPAGLTPLQAGIILDNRANTIEVSATIVELARQGYLTIEEVEGKFFGFGRDYCLTKADKNIDDLGLSERLLLNGLFISQHEFKKTFSQVVKSVKKSMAAAKSGLDQEEISKQLLEELEGNQPEIESGATVLLSDLKNHFYQTLSEVKRIAREEVLQQGYYTRSFFDSSQVLAAVIVISIFSLIGLGWLTIIFAEPFVFATGALTLLSFGIPGAIYLYYSPQLTYKGADTKYHLLGYKQFVETAEKYRAKFYEDQNLIFEVMPYAIMFGLAEKFARQIEEMDIQVSSPSWYIAAHPLSIGDFTRDMSSFSSNMNTTMASSPGGSGSSGGGSSGGGFGGGGGGSW